MSCFVFARVQVVLFVDGKKSEGHMLTKNLFFQVPELKVATIEYYMKTPSFGNLPGAPQTLKNIKTLNNYQTTVPKSLDCYKQGFPWSEFDGTFTGLLKNHAF